MNVELFTLPSQFHLFSALPAAVILSGVSRVLLLREAPGHAVEGSLSDVTQSLAAAYARMP